MSVSTGCMMLELVGDQEWVELCSISNLFGFISAHRFIIFILNYQRLWKTTYAIIVKRMPISTNEMEIHRTHWLLDYPPGGERGSGNHHRPVARSV